MTYFVAIRFCLNYGHIYCGSLLYGHALKFDSVGVAFRVVVSGLFWRQHDFHLLRFIFPYKNRGRKDYRLECSIPLNINLVNLWLIGNSFLWLRSVIIWPQIHSIYIKPVLHSNLYDKLPICTYHWMFLQAPMLSQTAPYRGRATWLVSSWRTDTIYVTRTTSVMDVLLWWRRQKWPHTYRNTVTWAPVGTQGQEASALPRERGRDLGVGVKIWELNFNVQITLLKPIVNVSVTAANRCISAQFIRM